MRNKIRNSDFDPNVETTIESSSLLSNTVNNNNASDSHNNNVEIVDINLHRAVWRHQQEKRHSIVDTICQDLTAAKSSNHNFYKIGTHVVEYLKSVNIKVLSKPRNC